MPSPVFKTRPGAPEVSIVGAGLCGPDGKGGVPCERGALSMVELQDDEGQPLEGKDLRVAAERFAESRDLVVVDLSDGQIAGLPQEVGQAPDRPPAAQVSGEEYARVYGQDKQDDDEAPAEPVARPIFGQPKPVEDNTDSGSPESDKE